MPTLKRARRKTANTSAANRRSRKERVDPLIAPADAPVEPGSAPLVIVGVGASAGGLEAFSQVLRGLSPEIGIAIVLIQHLAPQHDTILPTLLGGWTNLRVVQVTDGMTLAPNTVYVIPPNANMQIAEGMLHLTARAEDHKQFMPIDLFFRSLAESEQNRAVAVVLSGTASDGAAGLREIASVGGITIAQAPETAKYDGMPRAAIATGCVDLVLSPEEIATELMKIAHHPYLRQPHAERSEDASPHLDEQILKILILLRNASGVDFTQYKVATIKRRLQRRMVLNKVVGIENYIRHLQDHPDEIQLLYQDILIHVTQFFRDPESFTAMAADVFPALLQGGKRDTPIRIWVPGCATGEEAYSIAIALLEFMKDRAGRIPVQVFATDVSENAVQKARAGVFPATIEADVSPERLRVFFVKTDGSYRLGKLVRDMCVIARQDLSRDPPFSKLDVVVCRNVMIYLGPQLQRRLITTFHYALKPDGFLILGGAETIGTQTDLFSIVDKKHKIYQKRVASTYSEVHVPPPNISLPLPRKGQVELRGRSAVQDEASRILLAKYSPAAVVVDQDLQILEFRGQTGKYLEPAPGDASLNVMKMAREGLLYGLRSAIHEARKHDHTVVKEGLKVRTNTHWSDVDLEVCPFSGTAGRHFLVVFKETASSGSEEKPARARGRSGARRGKSSEKLTQLEQELAASREYLQSIIQDLEATNEELQSANEEILSSNEELQSTNEELDTAKEELQSTNEELNTLNDELHARNEELSRANSDLLNLLGSVQIALVMVASDMRIRQYTPMAERILNLIPSDIGRPISHIKPNIDCPDLESLVGDVIEKVTVVERDVHDRQGNAFSLLIRPYKNLENRIDGAVLALFDMDAKAALRDAKEQLVAVLQVSPYPVLVVDRQFKVVEVNRVFCRFFGIERKDVLNKALTADGHARWDLTRLHGALAEMFERAEESHEFEIDHSVDGGPSRRLSLTMKRSGGTDRYPGRIVVAIRPLEAER